MNLNIDLMKKIKNKLDLCKKNGTLNVVLRPVRLVG